MELGVHANRLVLAAALSVSGASAGAQTYWLHCGNTVSNLEAQTGISTDGRGQDVVWQDTTLRKHAPDTSYGTSGMASVQVPRTPVMVHNHLLISFAETNTPGEPFLSRSRPIEEAHLYACVRRARGAPVTLRVRGLRPENGAWIESAATFNTMDGQTAWHGGDFEGAVDRDYGVFAVTASEGHWMSLDVTEALRDLRAGVIAGIALMPEGEALPQIRNVYLATDEYPDPALRPGLLVRFEQGAIFSSDATGLVFHARQGPPMPQPFDFGLANIGEEAGTFACTPRYAQGGPTGWIHATEGGLVAPGTTSTVQVAVDHRTLAVGDYLGEVLLTSTNGSGLPLSVPVRLIVAEPSADLGGQLASQIIGWSTNHFAGLFEMSLSLCNTSSWSLAIKPPFRYAFRRTDLHRLWHVEGYDALGRDYVDVTEQVYKQLGGTLWAPGDCITLTNIQVYARSVASPDPRDETLWAAGNTNSFVPLPPRARDLRVRVGENQSATGQMPADSPDGSELSFAMLRAPEFGSVVTTDDGFFTYTPFPDYRGTDSLFYRVVTTHNLQDTGTVRFSVGRGVVNPAVIRLLLDIEQE